MKSLTRLCEPNETAQAEQAEAGDHRGGVHAEFAEQHDEQHQAEHEAQGLVEDDDQRLHALDRFGRLGVRLAFSRLAWRRIAGAAEADAARCRRTTPRSTSPPRRRSAICAQYTGIRPVATSDVSAVHLGPRPPVDARPAPRRSARRSWRSSERSPPPGSGFIRRRLRCGLGDPLGDVRRTARPGDLCGRASSRRRGSSSSSMILHAAPPAVSQSGSWFSPEEAEDLLLALREVPAASAGTSAVRRTSRRTWRRERTAMAAQDSPSPRQAVESAPDDRAQRGLAGACRTAPCGRSCGTGWPGWCSRSRRPIQLLVPDDARPRRGGPGGAASTTASMSSCSPATATASSAPAPTSRCCRRSRRAGSTVLLPARQRDHAADGAHPEAGHRGASTATAWAAGWRSRWPPTCAYGRATPEGGKPFSGRPAGGQARRPARAPAAPSGWRGCSAPRRRMDMMMVGAEMLTPEQAARRSA